MLHVYSNDVVDWFVAESPEEAREFGIAYAKQCGSDGEMYEEFTADDYTKEPDDKLLTINDEREPEGKWTMTCAEWCRANGKGFLCSTEY